MRRFEKSYMSEHNRLQGPVFNALVTQWTE